MTLSPHVVQRQIPVSPPAGKVVQDRLVDASTDKPQITNEALGVAGVLGYRNSGPSKAIPSIEFMSKPGVPARFKPKLVRIALGTGNDVDASRMFCATAEQRIGKVHLHIDRTALGGKHDAARYMFLP